MTTTSTELATTTDTKAAVLARLAVNKLSLNDVLTQLVTLEPEPKATVLPAKMPNPVEVPDELKQAMANLGSVYGKINPSTRRQLRPFENKDLREEYEVLETILAHAEKRMKAIKEIQATSLDVDLEKRKIVSEHTEIDADGHYRVAFPGSREEAEAGNGKIWVREGSHDKNTLDPTLLEIKYQTGEIPEEVYDAVTETRTVFSEALYKQLLLDPKTRNAALDLAEQIGRVKKGTTKIQLRPIPAKTTMTVI